MNISCRFKRILKRLGIWSIIKQLFWSAKIKGTVKVDLIRNGTIIDSRYIDNIVVDVGKAQVSGLINGIVTTPFTYIAIGDGSSTNPGTCTAEASGDTALGDELHRGAATTSQVTTSVTNDTAQLVATFDFTASESICESGVFDASTGGNMLCRTTFGVLNVENGDSLQVTWKIQVS